MEEKQRKISIVCLAESYDRDLKDRLLNHLTTFPASIFQRKDITPGKVQREEINKRLMQADIVLLLISAEFFASAECQWEMARAVQIAETRPVRLISVILRACVWEEIPIIRASTVLPSDEKAVTAWDDKDAAFEDIVRGIKEVMREIWALEEREGCEEDEKSYFSSSQEILLFKYLITNMGNDRIIHRRALMRFVYHQSNAGKYALSESDLFKEMHDFFYTRSDLKQDLAFLEQNGNLKKTSNLTEVGDGLTERFHIADTFTYTADPYALDIERMIDGWRFRRSTGGALDRSKLQMVQKNLEEIHRFLSIPEDFSPDSVQTFFETWKSLFENWKQLSRDIWLYMSNLENDARKDLYDLAAYSKYKDGIRNYIDGFDKLLAIMTLPMRKILTSWTELEKGRLLQYILSYHQFFGAGESQRQISPTLLKAEIYQQIADIQNWFLVRVPHFHHQAGQEIQRIVEQAKKLSAFFSKRIRNATFLQELASVCLQCATVEEARQVFSLAFAHILPLHFSLNALPEPGITEETDDISLWLAPAPYRPELRLRGPNKSKSQDAPVIEKSTQRKNQHNVQRSGLQAEFDEWTMYKRILDALPFHLESLTRTIVEPAFCVLLEQVISYCLADAEHCYTGRKGAAIVLLNPREQTYIRLHTTNGVLHLPRYIFDLAVQ